MAAGVRETGCAVLDHAITVLVGIAAMFSLSILTWLFQREPEEEDEGLNKGRDDRAAERGP